MIQPQLIQIICQRTAELLTEKSSKIIGIAVEFFRHGRGGDRLCKMQFQEPFCRIGKTFSFRGIVISHTAGFVHQQRKEQIAADAISVKSLFCQEHGNIITHPAGVADMPRLRDLFRQGIFSREMSPEKGKIRAVRSKSAVESARIEIKKIAAPEMKMPVFFKHIQSPRDHIDQLHGVDHPCDVSAGSAGNEFSAVGKMIICLPHKKLQKVGIVFFFT